jgi:hypothetical protein
VVYVNLLRKKVCVMGKKDEFGDEFKVVSDFA